jgi:hypothetical protein
MINYALIGSILTLTIFVFGLVFKAGQLSNKVEQLETWRANIRVDMHEISEELGKLTVEIGKLGTMIEEKTDRRAILPLAKSGS